MQGRPASAAAAAAARRSARPRTVLRAAKVRDEARVPGRQAPHCAGAGKQRGEGQEEERDGRARRALPPPPGLCQVPLLLLHGHLSRSIG